MSNTPTVKQGARHSGPDLQHGAAALDHLEQAATHLQQAGFVRNQEPGSSQQSGETSAEWQAQDWVPDKALAQDAAEDSDHSADELGLLAQTLVAFGGEAKSAPNGHIGGYLVRFSGPDDPDLTGDYFTKDTDFGFTTGQKTPVYFHHRLPLYTKSGDQIVIKKKIGEGTLSIDDTGVLIDAILFNREQYEKDINKVVKSLGWSSGTASHLVERELTGKAYHLKAWPLGLDASLTPTPAEPRNAAITLKAYVDSLPKAERPAPNGAHDPSTRPITAVGPKQELKTMADETRDMPADMKTVMDQILAGVTSIGKRVAALENEPPVREAGVVAGKTPEMLAAGQAPAVRTFKETFAQEQLATLKAYLRDEIGRDEWKRSQRAIAEHDANLNQAFNNVAHSWKGQNNRALETYNDMAVQNDYVKASLAEGTASLGGNLVPQLYGNQVVGKLKEASIVRKAGAYQFPVAGGYKFQVPTITRSGSAPIASELGAASQMEPTFGTVDFQAYAYRAQYIASREQVLDSRVPLDSILMDNAAWQFTQSENNHFAIGTGASQPQGIAKAASLSAASPGSTAALALANPDNIIDLYYSLPYQYRDNAVWFANDATIKVIRKTKWATTTGAGSTTTYNQYLWEPGLDVGRPDRLLGRPIYPLNSMYTDGAGAGSAVGCLVIANMDFFWIADFYNGGLDFQVLNELYAASAGIGWWFWKRMDSHLIITEAAQGLAFR